MAASTGRESDKFMLRLPDGLRELIKGAAEISNRSMNAEIVARLQQSLYYDPESEIFELRKRLDQILEILQEKKTKR